MTGWTRMVVLIDLCVPDEVLATNDEKFIKQGIQNVIGMTGARVIALGAVFEPESVRPGPVYRYHDDAGAGSR